MSAQHVIAKVVKIIRNMITNKSTLQIIHIQNSKVTAGKHGLASMGQQAWASKHGLASMVQQAWASKHGPASMG